MPRFVILHHHTPPSYTRPTHFDFMLEWGTALRTWALASEPVPQCLIEADALPDHRLAYLDYEGPISGDRGQVVRWERGDYRVLDESANELLVQLVGGALDGRARLTRDSQDAQRWRFLFTAS